MRHLLEQIEEFWCKNMHSDIMWPSGGRYLCRVCQREYRVQFDAVRLEPDHAVHRTASPAVMAARQSLAWPQ
jgi:hypothetical protein